VPVETVPADLMRSGRITKQRLYEIADDVADGSPDEVMAGFLIAVQAWGSGIKGLGGDGRGPWRAACGLGLPSRSPSSPLPEQRIQAIRRAVALSRSDVTKAWSTLYYGAGHIPKWGESFFTKLMHAAGYQRSARPWPLILDQRVRERLDDVKHPVGGGLSGYLAYLEKAHGWADDWGVTPARVEYALFHRPTHREVSG
jgi:Putative 8-oxoguanine DNA glycosylase OGG-like protein